jgi:voltage-gated potassium channel
MIIVVGVGIFGTFTGFLANFFLSPNAPPEQEEGTPDPDAEVTAEQQVATQVAQLRRLMAAQQTAIAEIDRLLEADGR